MPDQARRERIIDLTYVINEGPRVYVERIDIVGNVRTLDEVIRREFRLAEGDAFNTALLRRSRQRIQDLGFFETVELQDAAGLEPRQDQASRSRSPSGPPASCRSAPASRPRTARSATSA